MVGNGLDRSENLDGPNGMVKTIPYRGNPYSLTKPVIANQWPRPASLALSAQFTFCAHWCGNPYVLPSPPGKVACSAGRGGTTSPVSFLGILPKGESKTIPCAVNCGRAERAINDRPYDKLSVESFP